MNQHVLLDSLINLYTGLGGATDKSVLTSFTFTPLTRADLEYAYRGNWIARKIIDIPPEDSTREWRAWQADDTAIELIEEVEKRFLVKQKVAHAQQIARLYGGAAIIIGTEDGPAMEKELDLDRVKKDALKFLHVVPSHEFNCGEIITDILSPWYGEPMWYERVTNNVTNNVRIHPSRVVRFIGAPLPDPNSVTGTMNGAWGDSVLQVILSAVKDASIVNSAVAQLIHDAKLDIFGIPNLSGNLSTDEGTKRLTSRLTYANMMRSNLSTIVHDAGETYQRIQTSFAGLTDLQQEFMSLVCGSADIPATRMLGQSPKGMNATGESDTRNYYDRLASEQETDLTPRIERFDEVLIRSATGARDESIFYEWNPLWQMDDSQKADVAKKKADVFKIDVDAGIMSPNVLKEARENQLIEDGTYPGIEQAIEDEGGEYDPLAKQEEEAEKEHTQAMEMLKAKQAQGGPGDPAGASGKKPPLRLVKDFNPHHKPAGSPDGGQFASANESVNAAAAFGGPEDEVAALVRKMRSGKQDLTDPELARFEELTGKTLGPVPDPGEFEEELRALTKQFHAVGSGGFTEAEAARFEEIMHIINQPDWKPKRRTRDAAIQDAEPRTLYLYRPLKNAAALIAWAKSQGFETVEPAEEMHVTIVYSKQAFDWMKVDGWSDGGDEKGVLRVKPGGVRIVEALGNEGAVVLMFTSSALSWRHRDIVQAGASHDYDDYQPHITFTYKGGDIDLRKVEPYKGELVFGPECFEEIKQEGYDT